VLLPRTNHLLQNQAMVLIAEDDLIKLIFIEGLRTFEKLLLQPTTVKECNHLMERFVFSFYTALRSSTKTRMIILEAT